MNQTVYTMHLFLASWLVIHIACVFDSWVILCNLLNCQQREKRSFIVLWMSIPLNKHFSCHFNHCEHASFLWSSILRRETSYENSAQHRLRLWRKRHGIMRLLFPVDWSTALILFALLQENRSCSIFKRQTKSHWNASRAMWLTREFLLTHQMREKDASFKLA